MAQTIHFPSGDTVFYFRDSFKNLKSVTDKNIVIVTDKNLYGLYSKELESYKTVVAPAGETSKSLEMVKHVTEGLINYEVDKTYLIVALGGGMVTDLTGFVASIYMRGLKTAYVPTSLLAMVDASIGGKNGVNLGDHKNMLGTIRQPEFILYDTSFLRTLPDREWSNGFAEIIKYGCIFDTEMLQQLLERNIDFYKNDHAALEDLIERCTDLKNKTVLEDEQEHGIRKLLNFGHTVGHALEGNYQLSHGEAISVGMMVACELSERSTGLTGAANAILKSILTQYLLPVNMDYDEKRIMQTLRMDKKRAGDLIDFVMIKELGAAIMHKTSFEEIEQGLLSYKNRKD